MQRNNREVAKASVLEAVLFNKDWFGWWFGWCFGGLGDGASFVLHN
jgi:hypothetical protein